jgi:hypothetical protein
MMFCIHSWAFPLRCPTFGAHTNVDVQTCAKCGSRRLSIIQFANSSLNIGAASPPSRALELTDA